MVIPTYFERIKTAINYYSLFSYVESVTVSYEFREGEQGYMVGCIVYQDESELHFREYLDETGNTLKKLRYSYHYQSALKELLFRYDNARHRPPLDQLEHKHLPNGEIFLVDAPDMEDVLTEIVTMRDWRHNEDDS